MFARLPQELQERYFSKERTMTQAVLLCERSNEAREITEQTLSEMGIRVIPCENARGLHGSPNALQSDLIIVFSGPDGRWDETNIWSLREDYPTTTIIAVSEVDWVAKDIPSKAAFQKMGADGFVHLKFPLSGYKEDLQNVLSSFVCVRGANAVMQAKPSSQQVSSALVR